MDIENVEVKKALKFVFMGTPEFSVPVLDALIKNYVVEAVVTQPDKMVGREGKIVKSPIKKLAEEHNLLVLQPTKIRNEYQEIIDLNPDIIVTCAYGQILPPELLDAPRLGCINVHASLLPKLRGGAPIHRAILNGYKKTGITIMYMAPGMDDGDIIAQREIPIDDTDTAESLHDKLSKLGTELLLETLPSIIEGTNTRTPQDESLATFAPIIKPEDEKLDFSRQKHQIYNRIRGLNSFPGAYAMLNGKRLKVWASRVTDNYFTGLLDGQITAIYEDGFGVKVSDGEVVFTDVQLEGKNRMDAKSFSNGFGKDKLVGKMLS